MVWTDQTCCQCQAGPGPPRAGPSRRGPQAADRRPAAAPWPLAIPGARLGVRVAHPQQGAAVADLTAEVHAGSRVHVRPLSSEIEEPPPGSWLETRYVRRKLWTPSVG